MHQYALVCTSMPLNVTKWAFEFKICYVMHNVLAKIQGNLSVNDLE